MWRTRIPPRAGINARGIRRICDTEWKNLSGQPKQQVVLPMPESSIEAEMGDNRDALRIEPC